MSEPPHKDQPREAIMALAEKTLRKLAASGVPAKAYFKFTCPDCGERCTFRDPNMLWEEGECDKCGKRSRVDVAGFALHVDFSQKDA